MLTWMHSSRMRTAHCNCRFSCHARLSSTHTHCHAHPPATYAPPTTHAPMPHMPPHGQNSWHTLVKILPYRNFVAGGKYFDYNEYWAISFTFCYSSMGRPNVMAYYVRETSTWIDPLEMFTLVRDSDRDETHCSGPCICKYAIIRCNNMNEFVKFHTNVTPHPFIPLFSNETQRIFFSKPTWI